MPGRRSFRSCGTSASRWSGPGTVAFVILLILKVTIGIRASDEAQEEGLDLADHGEKAYNY